LTFPLTYQLHTTITTTIVDDVTCLQNLLHRLKKKENERACVRASELKDAQPPLPSTLLTYSSIFRLFVQHLQEVFFLPVPYFLLLSVNIAMMILNFFTRLHTYRSHRTQRLLKTVHIHIKRKKRKYLPSLNKVELIDWSRF